MRIIRQRARTDFTVVQNAVLRDRRLSYRALGLLVELLSRPDDWRTSATDLCRDRKEGRDAVRAALTEIEEAGYLVRVRQQNDRGQWSTVWHLFDTPHDGQQDDETDGFPAGDGFPGVGHPDAGHPDAGGPGPLPSTETKNRDETARFARGGAPDPDGQLVLLDDPSQATVSAHRRTKPDVQRGHRLPDYWQPAPADVAWSRAQGYPDAWAAAVTEQFRDYWRAVPGQRGRKLDWPATWRNWLRREADARPPGGQPRRPSTTDQRVAEGLRLARHFAEQESLA